MSQYLILLKKVQVHWFVPIFLLPSSYLKEYYQIFAFQQRLISQTITNNKKMTFDTFPDSILMLQSKDAEDKTVP
jgi:hypothetical protein